MKLAKKIVSLALPVLLLAGAAAAQTAATDLLKSVQVSGLVDGYASLNTNDPGGAGAAQNQDFSFATAGNQFAFNLAEVDLTVPAKTGGVGFTTALIAGPAVGVIEGSNNTGMSHVLQAYATYKPTDSLSIDFGRFVTSLGAELIESPSNWNYSRSILFGFAIPFDHFGVRVTDAINDKVTVYGMMVNGWNTVADNNSSKTFGAGFSVAPTSAVSLAENLISGPEGANDNHNLTTVSDSILTINASPAVSFMANYDFGEGKTDTGTNRWQGIAGYLHFTLTKAISITPRVEWYWDPQSATVGAPKMNEQTLTFEVKQSEHVITRVEVRHDHANVPFFAHSGGLTYRDQTVALASMMLVF